MAGRLAIVRSFSSRERLDVADTPFTPTPEPTFGRDEIIKKLKDLLRFHHSSTFIGLHGMGGARKTFVAETLYNLPTVRFHFDHISWLTLGRDYDITNLVDIQKIYSDSRAMECEVPTIEELDVHKNERKKMFVVLDDVWTKEVIEFIVRRVTWIQGSKILMTTRLKNFQAFKVISQVDIHTLGEKESLELFMYYAFPCGKEDSISQQVKHVAIECKGLSLALKVIGKSMVEKTLREWDETLTKLKSQELVGDEHRKLIEHLKISYDALKNLESYVGSKLQDCFLYFGAFKEDEEVRVLEWTKCCNGEGLLRPDRTPIEATYLVLGVLLASSLIEKTRSDFYRRHDVGLYKVHDVLRDLILHMSKMEKKIEILFQPASSTMLAKVPQKFVGFLGEIFKFPPQKSKSKHQI